MNKSHRHVKSLHQSRLFKFHSSTWEGDLFDFFLPSRKPIRKPSKSHKHKR
jgi:hypothetical protein